MMTYTGRLRPKGRDFISSKMVQKGKGLDLGAEIQEKSLSFSLSP